MALLKEMWTGELIKHFRHENEFLSKIASRNDYVNNNAIHLADMGADPEVLINNTTYPIPVTARTDEDIAIALDKFDTKNTKITEDEIYALPYDKKGSVISQHREVLEEKTGEKSLHALAAASHTTNTPVIVTTGATDGESNARKRMTMKDIIRMKRKFDDLKVPKKNRELVLAPQHVEDLLLISQTFEKQYQAIKEGKILNLYGFNITEYVAPPIYGDVTGTLTKKAFGAAVAPTTDQVASIAFYSNRAVQARGDVTMYLREAKNDPDNRMTVVGFRVYHICLPKKWLGFGAIVSDLVA